MLYLLSDDRELGECKLLSLELGSILNIYGTDHPSRKKGDKDLNWYRRLLEEIAGRPDEVSLWPGPGESLFALYKWGRPIHL